MTVPQVSQRPDSSPRVALGHARGIEQHGILTISYPYVPMGHGPRFQDVLERAVMGDAWVERVRAAVLGQQQGSA